MKIIFLCGCLEPGRDGVGDYTRRLSIELIRLGHQVTALALSDGFITAPLEEKQVIENEHLQVLRIPASVSRKDCLILSKTWVTKHDPSWVCLQFVPFSFSSKGLPFYLPAFLKEVGKGRAWHIMFHELWVFINFEKSKKQWLLGNIQRWLIKQLVFTLRPLIIHTQTRLYQKYLYQIGFESKYLPLFSNIPVIQEPGGPVKDLGVESTKRLSFVIFGSIHPDSLFGDFTNDAILYSARNSVEVSLVFIGRYNAEQKHWCSVWTTAGLKAILLGERSPEQISKELKKACIGITTTPLVLVEKSGTVAAMREHGLPVVCIARPWFPKNYEGVFSSEIFTYSKGNFESILAKSLKPSTINSLLNITTQFVDDLESTKHGSRQQMNT